MNKEIWRPVLGFENIYEVSNLGKVRSVDRLNARGFKLKGKMMKIRLNSFGYCVVTLHKNSHQYSKLVHTLVAMAFPDICGTWFEGCEVGHYDCVRTNNEATNLYVCTHKENCNNELTIQNYSKRMIEYYKTHSHPCLGTHLSEERKKMVSDRFKGKPKSEEQKRKMSEARKGKSMPKGKDSPCSIVVERCDINWNVIAVYESMGEAERQTGISSSKISMVCNGKRNFTGGSRWRKRRVV